MMSTKKNFFGVAVLTFVVAATAAADNSYVTRARVVESIPIVETVYEEREICRDKYISERRSSYKDKTGEKIVGGVLGGLAGSAVGKGSGKDAAAGIGAILGGEIASQDGELTEGELIGGIAGGLLGNQIGKGGGKTASTAAGAIIGSIVGDNLQNGGVDDSAYTEKRRKVKVCDIKEFPKKIITGYEVVFEHDDLRFTQILSREPSNYININVSVEALEERTGGL